jgi:hypothetical protein
MFHQWQQDSKLSSWKISYCKIMALGVSFRTQPRWSRLKSGCVPINTLVRHL